MTPTPQQPSAATAWLASHLPELEAVGAALQADGTLLDSWAAHLAGVLARGGRLLAAGNGGSAAEAQHLTAEIVGRFVVERAPYSAIALHGDSSSVTAIANDYGAEQMYARQVLAHGRDGDVLVLLSTSGASANILAAAHAARSRGMLVWAMTGAAPNPLADVADEVLAVPGMSTSSVQEGHLVALHALCAALDVHLLGGSTSGAPGAEAATDEAATTQPAELDLTLEDAEMASATPVPGAHTVTSSPPPRRSTRGRVLVVGDVLLDRDVTGRSERLAPDAPVPVVDIESIVERPGGAGLVAALLAEDGAEVTLLAPVAGDDDGTVLRERLAAMGVRVIALEHQGRTRVKTMVKSGSQSLVRLDDGGPGAPSGVSAEVVRAAADAADVVLVSDYGAGTTSDPTVRAVLAESARRRPMVWDPHPRGGRPVPGVVLVTPNLAEARGALAASGVRPPTDAADVAAGAARLWQARNVAVTAGAEGAWLVAPGSEPLFVPATPAAGDPCGAGDRFAASAALSLARGSVPSQALVDAVADASAWVAAGGAGAWQPGAAASTGPLGRPSQVASTGDAGAVPQRPRKRVVATGGCFDVLHAGHVACLDAAARLGDRLVVLINSDDSVRRLKGEGRPVNPAADRAQVLLALGCVDEVLVFDEDDPRAALDRLRPDLWVKGGDYGGAALPEAPLVRSWGGRVVLLPYLEGRSSTAILARGASSTATRRTVPGVTSPTD